jgi:peptidyl-prolyl cis-trans isomerase C
MMKKRNQLWLVCVAMVVANTAVAQTLISGHGVKVETQELQSDLERMPKQSRVGLSTPEAMQSNVTNLYVRKVLAKEAAASGVDKNPLVQVAIQKAIDRILSDAMLEKIDQNNQPSLQNIEAYAQSMYKANPKRFETQEEVRVRHILIRTAEPDAKAKAEAILAQLKAGAEFEKLAKEKSHDPGSAAKGGDLGMFGRGRMIKPFEETAFGLKKTGDLSDVIETPFGFHIIRLEEKKPVGLKPFAEVKEQLMQEAQKEILNQGRIAERDRILKDAQYNKSGIEELAKAQANLP